MFYTLLGVALIIFIGLYGMTNDDLQQKKETIKSLEEQVDRLKKALYQDSQEYAELRKQIEQDLRTVIYYCVLTKEPDYDSPEQLTQIIMDHLYYVGDISNVEDLLKYDFDYIRKVTLYAKMGLLDVYQDCELRYLRYTDDGQEIFLSDEEAKKIMNGDYSSIFENS